MPDYEQAVFISYAWGGEREDIVNQIDQALQTRGIKIIRDKRDLGYKGSINEFMERIGQGNCVIVVISDRYLRSPNCMFELVEIAEGNLHITFIDDQTIAVEDIPYDGTPTSRISLWDLTTSSKNDFTFDGDLNGLISNGSILLYRDNEARVILQEQSSEDLSRFEKMRDLMCKTVGRNFTQTEWAEYFNKDSPYPTKQTDATCPQWPLGTEVSPTATP